MPICFLQQFFNLVTEFLCRVSLPARLRARAGSLINTLALSLCVCVAVLSYVALPRRPRFIIQLPSLVLWSVFVRRCRYRSHSRCRCRLRVSLFIFCFGSIAFRTLALLYAIRTPVPAFPFLTLNIMKLKFFFY